MKGIRKTKDDYRKLISENSENNIRHLNSFNKIHDQ